MNSDTDLAAAIPTGIASFDFEVVFQSQYSRIARVIAQVVGDRARAEELSAEVFYRLWRADAQKVRNVGGWLHKTAVRIALDELRHQSERLSRRSDFSQLLGNVVHTVHRGNAGYAGHESCICRPEVPDDSGQRRRGLERCDRFLQETWTFHPLVFGSRRPRVWSKRHPTNLYPR